MNSNSLCFSARSAFKKIDVMLLGLERFLHCRANHIVWRAPRHFGHDDFHHFTHIAGTRRARLRDGGLHERAQILGGHGFWQEGFEHFDLGFVVGG